MGMLLLHTPKYHPQIANQSLHHFHQFLCYLQIVLIPLYIVYLYQEKGISDDQQNVKPVSYSVVKSGLIGLTRYLATYWAEKKVRCNAICPGGVLDGQDVNFLDRVQQRIPMNRLAKPDEYQGTLIWMLSDASSYLNGAVVPVDGGRTTW